MGGTHELMIDVDVQPTAGVSYGTIVPQATFAASPGKTSFVVLNDIGSKHGATPKALRTAFHAHVLV
jgi:hypothetical protein